MTVEDIPTQINNFKHQVIVVLNKARRVPDHDPLAADLQAEVTTLTGMLTTLVATLTPS